MIKKKKKTVDEAYDKEKRKEIASKIVAQREKEGRGSSSGTSKHFFEGKEVSKKEKETLTTKAYSERRLKKEPTTQVEIQDKGQLQKPKEEAGFLERAEKSRFGQNLMKFDNLTTDLGEFISGERSGKDFLKTVGVSTGVAAAGAGSIALLGPALGIGSIMGAAGLATWAAVDNIGQQAAFLANGLVDDVRYGTISKERARGSINNAKARLENAEDVITVTTMTTPALWPFASIYLDSIDQSKEVINNAIIGLNQIIERGSEEINE